MNNSFLVYQAKSFYNAYIALNQIRTPEDELLYLVPEMVNGALSVELTLKAILTEQNIPYEHEHNLKILFDKLPLHIQNMIWYYVAQKAPMYSDHTKCENELLLMSEAFVQWRYVFEGNLAAAFEPSFLAVFANAAIFVMFYLGYNVFYTKVEDKFSVEELAEIESKFETNRRESLLHNQEIIEKKKRRNNNG